MTGLMLGLGLTSAFVPIWSPALLMGAGYWAAGYGRGGLWQDAAGLTPAVLASQPVGYAKGGAGTASASQATALSKPTLARWPKTGRRNLLNYSDCRLAGANWLASSALCEDLALNIEGKYKGVSVKSQGADWHRLQTSSGNISADGVAGQKYTVTALVKRGTSAKMRSVLQNNTAVTESSVVLDFATGVVTVLYTAAGAISGVSATHLGDDVWRIRHSVTLSANASLRSGIGPSSGVAGEDVIALAMQLELGEGSSWQDVKSPNDITEAGVPDLWHLYNDGGDSLNVVLPAGVYGVASIDLARSVTVGTVTSDGTTPINTLRHERQLDVVIRAEAFSSTEQAALSAYWAEVYI